MRVVSMHAEFVCYLALKTEQCLAAFTLVTDAQTSNVIHNGAIPALRVFVASKACIAACST